MFEIIAIKKTPLNIYSTKHIMKYYQTAGGYCYKQDQNGKCQRISKQEYQKYQQTGGGFNYNDLYSQNNPQPNHQLFHQQFGGRYQQTGGIKLKGVTGAGIIILEQYRPDKNSPHQWAVILFKDAHSNLCGDLGGNVDQGDQFVSQVARREAQEESCNYIQFKNTKVFGEDINNQQTFVEHWDYRCYFVAVKTGKIFSNTFNQNRLKLLQNGAQHHWLETNQMVRFNLQDLLNAGVMTKGGDLPCIDARGNPQIVQGRSKACIREAYKAGLIQLLTSTPSAIRKVSPEQTNYNQSPSYLNGTKSVIIHE